MRRRRSGPAVRNDIVQFVATYWQQHNHAPSYQIIGDVLDTSKRNVSYHADILVEEGRLVKSDDPFYRLRLPGAAERDNGMNPATETRLDTALVLLRDYWSEYYCSPTTDRLGEMMGLSSPTIVNYMRLLQEQGRVVRLPGKRGYRPAAMRVEFEIMRPIDFEDARDEYPLEMLRRDERIDLRPKVDPEAEAQAAEFRRRALIIKRHEIAMWFAKGIGVLFLLAYLVSADERFLIAAYMATVAAFYLARRMYVL
jgi:biotin operon repressor